MNQQFPRLLRRRRLASTARVAMLAAVLSLSGCGSLSGLGGGFKYACKAPEGVACDSVSGTYANALQHNLPSQQKVGEVQTATAAGSPGTAPPRTPLAAAPAIATTAVLAPTLGATPLRSQARVLRLWTKPWEDADGDLYDQGYLYVQVSAGQWLIDHVQRQIRDAFAPLRPPAKTNGDGAAGTQDAGSAAEPVAPSRTAPSSAPFQAPGQFPGGRPPGTSFNRAQ